MAFAAIPAALCGQSWNGQERSPDFGPQLSGEVFNFQLIARGSQYHYADWLRGDVLLYSGQVSTNHQLRYNGYRDAVVWLHPESMQEIRLDIRLVQGFTLYGPRQDTMVYERIRTSDGHFFAERLHKGKHNLFVYRKVEQTGEVIERAGNALHARAILEARPAYYLIDRQGNDHRLRRINRRSLLGAFPEQRRELRQLLRSHRASIGNEAQLVRAVSLIDDWMKQQGL